MPDRCRPRRLSFGHLKPRSLKPRAMVFDPATNSVTIELEKNMDTRKEPSNTLPVRGSINTLTRSRSQGLLVF